MGKLPAKHNPFASAEVTNLASFTIGAEASNVINVAIQMKDSAGHAIAQRTALKAYLATVATGATVATPPTTVAIGTNGTLLGGGRLGTVATLTDNTAGTANDTLEALADIATAGGAEPSATQVDTAVNAVLAKIRNNFADLAAKVNAILNSKEEFILVTNASGQVDVNITKSGAATYYLILVMPDGSLVASGAITFAA